MGSFFFFFFVYRTDRSSEEKAHAVNAPRVRPTPSTAADINDFYCSHGHMHEDLLRKTVKQIGVKLQGQMAPCQGCSEVKWTRKPVKPVTHTREAKLAKRCFVDLAGPNSVQSPGGGGVNDDSESRRFFAIHQGIFPPYQRRDSHVFFKVPGRDRSPQGRGGGE